jgi:hypothetical protein
MKNRILQTTAFYRRTALTVAVMAALTAISAHAKSSSLPDLDGDGIPNLVDPDVDNDGIPNGRDSNVDGGMCRSGPYKGRCIGDHRQYPTIHLGHR